MKQTEARALARKMMDDHGLSHWRLTFMDNKTRLGVCWYHNETIGISTFFLNKGDDLVRDTILHEIAHALVGHGAAHGLVWKRKCLEIGANPNRTADVKMEDSEFAWVGKCKCGGAVKRNHRRPKRLTGWFCTKCFEGLSWTHNGIPVQDLTQKNFAAAAASVPTVTRKNLDSRGGGRYSQGFTDIEALFGDDE